jgi:hypothetical protein
MTELQLHSLLSLLNRIAVALENIAPTPLEKKARENGLYKDYGVELVNVWKQQLGLKELGVPHNDEYLNG